LEKRITKIPAFEELYRQIRIINRRKEEQLQNLKMFPTTTAITSLEAIIPLVPKKSPDQSNQKDKFISFELKARAGQRDSGSTYKKQVKLFDEGTPQEWINLRKDLGEIWTQNSISGPVDRKSVARAILRGESLTTFDTAIDTLRTPGPDDEEARLQLELTVEMVSKALDKVSKLILPVRALELQKLWMQKVMKKPYNLRIRQTVAAIGRLNNDLPFYPGGSASSKFETREIISIIEWCVPEDYRIKMNKEGWIPAEHSMPEFITKLETIEAYLKTIQLKEEAKKGCGRIKKQGGRKRKNDDDGHKEYYCAYHGTNPSHLSKQCKVLKAQ